MRIVQYSVDKKHIEGVYTIQKSFEPKPYPYGNQPLNAFNGHIVIEEDTLNIYKYKDGYWEKKNNG